MVRDPQIARNNSIRSASTFGCINPIHSSHLLRCLSTRSSNDIEQTAVKRDINWITWKPIIDSQLRDSPHQCFPSSPEVMMDTIASKWRASNFSLMTGISHYDGLHRVILNRLFNLHHTHLLDDQFFSHFIKQYARQFNVYISPETSKAFEDAVKFVYSTECTGRNYSSSFHCRRSFASSIVDILADSWLLSPMNSLVQSLIHHDINTFVYLLNYSSPSLQYLLDSPLYRVEQLFTSGAPFVDPMVYPTPHLFKQIKWSDSDRNFSHLLMQMWANFAKSANPTPIAVFNSLRWQPTHRNNPLLFVSLNNDLVSSSSHQSTSTLTEMNSDGFRVKYSQFWSQYIPSILRRNNLPPHSIYDSLDIQIHFYQILLYTLATLTLFILFILLYCFYFHITNLR